jgi:hypothetical protein
MPVPPVMATSSNGCEPGQCASVPVVCLGLYRAKKVLAFQDVSRYDSSFLIPLPDIPHGTRRMRSRE